MQKLSRVNRLFTHSRFFFSYLPKNEKMIKKEDKDFTKIQLVQSTLNEMQTEFMKTEIDPNKKLSEAVALDPKSEKFRNIKLYPQFSPDKEKLNKIIKKEFNKKIHETAVSGFEEYSEEILHDQLTSAEENRRKIEEFKQFKKMLFKKEETKRLLKRESLKIENILQKDKVSSNLSYKQYEENLNTLKNKRIQNFLSSVSSNNENKKLAILIESGLLDKSKNISTIIDQSLKTLKDIRMKGELQNSTNTSYFPEILHEDGSESSTSVVTTSENLPTKNNEKDLDINYLFNVINSSDFDLNAEELQNVSFSKLSEFFKEFIESTPEEKANLLENLRLTKEIRQYEELIFDKYRNNDITLRVKGRLKFQDLTESENINYVKYNIESFEDALKMFENLDSALTPRVANAIIQKITHFYLTTKPLDKNYDIKMLNLFQDYRYKSVLKYILNSFDKISNKEFVIFLWSLGKLHQREKGVIHYRLFEKIKEKAIEQVLFLFNFFDNIDFSKAKNSCLR